MTELCFPRRRTMFRRTSQADLSMGGNITPEAPASRNTNLSSPVLKNSCRCLDAAHGKAARTVVVGQRIRHVRTETQPGTVRMPRRIGRRSPRIAATADVVQGSRPLGAVARSRRCGAIAKRECGGGCGTMVFATIAGTSCGSFELCGPQPWPAQARKHPAVAGRAPQAASESQALCHSERSEESFSLANRRPRTDYASQGGERQTKCSQESVYVYFYTDSSSLCSSE